MDELPLAFGVGRGGVGVALEDPLGGQESLHAHGTTGVNPTGGDAHLGA